jgi:hypothetical protein
MLGLSRTRPVDNLLSRFRAAPSETDSPPAQMATTASISPPAGAVEIIPRWVTGQDTRSQKERRARADAGDLQSSLDLIPLPMIEDQLSRHFRTAQPDCSILECLNGNNGAFPSHKAASVVLEELADSTEQAALTSALVYRYVQAKSLWKGHPDPKVTSVESFLETLDNADYVKANIVIGSSADLVRQRSLREIEQAWGPGWFGKIPHELRDPNWSRAEKCSKRVLKQMAATVRHGHNLEHAIEHWTQSMRRRTDESARRVHGIILPRSPYIILDDVRSLNENSVDRSGARDAGHNDIPESPKDDRLRVELVPPISPIQQFTKKTDYSAARPSRAPKKRKRAVPGAPSAALVDSSRDEGADEADGWRVLTDGKEMVKRVRNSLVRKPVDITSSDVQPSEDPAPTQRSSSATQEALTASRRQPRPDEQESYPSPTCDGPGVALLLHKLIDAFHGMSTLDDDPKADHRCCEQCRPKVLRALKVLEDVLLPCAEDLEKVQGHRCGDGDVEASQITDISPRKRALVRKHTSLFIRDSSDED